jgi:purine-nucleoside phosphorylase
MDDLFDRIETAARFIKSRSTLLPATGIILGTGLGALTDAMDIDCTIPYAQIPSFPASTVKGHCGELILGTLGGRPVVAMAGRFHYYEGYSMKEVTFPVRVMKALGAGVLMVSNAAGGMNSSFRVGDMMILRDHINLMPEHPLRGANDERLGVRFPDMSEPYCPEMIGRAMEVAGAAGMRVHTGVYAGVPGPTFETRAEYEYLRRMGADAVGMSTVPEVIVAVHAGMKVFALSVITDLGVPGELVRITHEEVLEAAARTAPLMTTLFEQMVAAEAVNPERH